MQEMMYLYCVQWFFYYQISIVFFVYQFIFYVYQCGIDYCWMVQQQVFDFFGSDFFVVMVDLIFFVFLYGDVIFWINRDQIVGIVKIVGIKGIGIVLWIFVIIVEGVWFVCYQVFNFFLWQWIFFSISNLYFIVWIYWVILGMDNFFCVIIKLGVVYQFFCYVKYLL